MTLLVLVILAVIWAAVLLPPYLQNRSENRPADSISTFRNQLTVLERRSTLGGPAVGAGPAPVRYAPAARSGRVQADRARMARIEAKRRRRDILVTLLIASGLTLLLGLVMPAVLLVHLFVDALLGAYVALLVRQKRIAEERSMKVRYLGDRPARPAPIPAPQLALRRTAAN